MRDDYAYQILGPLTVRKAGERIDISGFRRQTLLAMLLVRANQVNSLDRLVEAIWDTAPPASANSQVRICVSGLRRQLMSQDTAQEGGGVIETYPAGYLIRVPDDALDLHRFAGLTAKGRAALEANRPEVAADLLRSALDLWRGPIAEGLDSQLLISIAAKYGEDRLTVSEEYFEVELLLGRHRKIIGDLTGFVMENPFREKACAQLMLALYRSGRQADALEVFRVIRKRFSEELGIEPSKDLRFMQESILTGDSVPRQRPRPSQPEPEPAAVLNSKVVSITQSPGDTDDNESGSVRTRRATSESLQKLRRENALLRAERDALRQVMSLWLNSWEAS